MEEKGQVYKFTGIYGHIRPDNFGATRRDILFKKHEHKLKIGDRVIYDHVEKNGRRYAEKLNLQS